MFPAHLSSLKRGLWTGAAILSAWAVTPAAAAAPSATQAAIVDVVCDTRLGTGALTSLNDGGYVVTVGHVAIDPQSHVQAAQCVVGFMTGDTLEPNTYYRASIEHAVFDERLNRDYAVLRIEQRLSGSGSLPAPLKTFEFAAAGDGITVYGFPEGSRTMQSASGVIKGFRRGEIFSDVPISQGYSGGPAINASGYMVGVAERVNFLEDKGGVRTITDYDLGDVLSLITWLDTFGTRAHDRYLTHADAQRYDGAHLVYRNESPGCSYRVITESSPSLFCLLGGPYRQVFTTEASYYSWYPDFSGIQKITAANLSEYQLIGNVTMRAGSLVKIQTDPKVYVVTDSIGTLRWVPTEELAAAVFGADWAKRVRDIPAEFFFSYRIADPIQ